MTDEAPSVPDDDLLEFLGGIDEVNDESQDGDFADFLARTDIERVATPKPSAPGPRDDHE